MQIPLWTRPPCQKSFKVTNRQHIICCNSGSILHLPLLRIHYDASFCFLKVWASSFAGRLSVTTSRIEWTSFSHSVLPTPPHDVAVTVSYRAESVFPQGGFRPFSITHFQTHLRRFLPRSRSRTSVVGIERGIGTSVTLPARSGWVILADGVCVIPQAYRGIYRRVCKRESSMIVFVV
jgi:hypothetical protein